MTEQSGVWVFKAEKATFASGVFDRRELADAWILSNRLSGVLTWYPMNEGTYDWAVRNDRFKPKRDDQTTPEFIGRFTAAAQEHYHYERGVAGETE